MDTVVNAVPERVQQMAIVKKKNKLWMSHEYMLRILTQSQHSFWAVKQKMIEPTVHVNPSKDKQQETW